MKNQVKPDVEKLQDDPGYRQLLELDFNDMIPFVLSSIRRKGVLAYLYAGINTGMLIFIILYLIQSMVSSDLIWPVVIKQSVAGIISGSILIIPVHELLHGLAYRLLGAKSIRFGADMRQFIFYVTADRHPVSGWELYFLAFTPFLLINVAITAITLIWFPGTILYMAFFLLSHNIMCIGDFAIANYVQGMAPRRIITFDEPERKKSYFYEEVSNQSH